MNGGGRVVGVCGAALVVFLAMIAWWRTGDVIPEVLQPEKRANLSAGDRDALRRNHPVVESTGTEECETEEEREVEAFDDLTDSWQEVQAGGVSLADVDAFVKAFRSVPGSRQGECIHRALNLIPDENVMLLVGVLMDKSVDREIAEDIFNDILNRDEDVKKPILLEILKDKSHPCWADTAWILDTTGE